MNRLINLFRFYECLGNTILYIWEKSEGSLAKTDENLSSEDVLFSKLLETSNTK